MSRFSGNLSRINCRDILWQNCDKIKSGDKLWQNDPTFLSAGLDLDIKEEKMSVLNKYLDTLVFDKKNLNLFL